MLHSKCKAPFYTFVFLYVISLKASRSNWQVFFLVKKRNEDNIKDSFSYEETRRFSKRHFFLTQVQALYS